MRDMGDKDLFEINIGTIFTSCLLFLILFLVGCESYNWSLIRRE